MDGGLMIWRISRIAFLLWGIALVAWYFMADGAVPDEFWMLCGLFALQGFL